MYESIKFWHIQFCYGYIFYTRSWLGLAYKIEIIFYLKSYHLYIDLRGRHPNITASETTYMQDDQSTVGLVLALICGVGSIFICFAFVTICYRWLSKCFNVLSFSRGVLNVMCVCFSWCLMCLNRDVCQNSNVAIHKQLICKATGDIH